MLKRGQGAITEFRGYEASSFVKVNEKINFVKEYLFLHFLSFYSSNYITKKEPKSEARVSKFDWHDLFPFFLDTKPKSILETNKTSFASYSLIQ